MKIEQIFTGNSLRNYDYILECDNGDQIIVDPSSRLLQEKLSSCVAVFLTHEHHDHIVGLGDILKKHSAKVYCHSIAQRNLGIECEILDVEQTIEVAGESFDIILIPGHIPSHIGLIHHQTKSAFLGDTVFNAGVGNVYDGNVEELYQSIQKIKKSVPKDYTLYSEHDYWLTNLNFTLSIDENNKSAKSLKQKYESSDYIETGMFPAVSLEQEYEYNLFFRTSEPVIKDMLRQKLDLDENCSEQDLFIGLRMLRNNW